MPEGDTIYRTAVSLRPLMEGQTVTAARSRDSTLPIESLVGRMFSAVESRGKHLLQHLDDGHTLHSHLGMHGSWHIYEPGQPWQKPEKWAAVVIDVPATVFVCFSPKTLELLTETQLRRHPHISELGPDLLDEEFDYDEALTRFRVHDPTPIGQAVMNQTIVCGIGNVYKSEVLFLCHTNPFITVSQLSDDEVLQIIKLAVDLMKKNLDGYPRRTRFGLDRQNHWVAVRLKELCESRDSLRAQHDSGIEHQQSRVTETEEQLEDAKEELDRMVRKHDRLKRTLDSFWGRMGIRLRSIFSTDAPSVKKARQRLDGFKRGLKKIGEKVEYATRVWTKQKRALEHLTAPIEDLEFAINYLEQEKEIAESETAEQNEAIDKAIHQSVRAMTPTVLRHELPQLAAQLGTIDLRQTMTRLRMLLAKSQTLSQLGELEAVRGCAETTSSTVPSPSGRGQGEGQEDSGFVSAQPLSANIDRTLDNLSGAIAAGFATTRGRGSGRVELSGQGATRVKKTRTRRETTTDSSGRPTTRTRTETYWDRVNVKFSGTVDVGFDVESSEWAEDTTVESLRTEADAWFRHGVRRVGDAQLLETMDNLRKEIATLTGRIRSALENSTFVH